MRRLTWLSLLTCDYRYSWNTCSSGTAHTFWLLKYWTVLVLLQADSFFWGSTWLLFLISDYWFFKDLSLAHSLSTLNNWPRSLSRASEYTDLPAKEPVPKVFSTCPKAVYHHLFTLCSACILQLSLSTLNDEILSGKKKDWVEKYVECKHQGIPW